MRTAFLTLAMIVSAASSAQGRNQNPYASIRKADHDWSAAFTSRNLDAAVSAMDDTGRVLAPNAPAATTRAAISEEFKGFFALRDVKIGWTPDLIQVARSGEIGYSSGRYLMSWRDEQKLLSDHGKYVTIWKKGRNGQWTVLMDIFNSDLPSR